ncbi:hypothetical protein IWW37_003185 [Coemansia sp. RSA 2050]|nr:hypothetical protein IWW37_003185 [Coemansia sp. RSA 2050]KAJ2733154.1 hypothetical protein IW152_003311 [Coemansia sp. BCRC 34962]
MLELRVDVDKECAECLVYQHQESSLRGKLFLKTSDKLKLRQITIRLVSTELVDIHETGEVAVETSGFLQKSTKTIGTWVVLAKTSDAHLLGAGEHQYSFEIALPKGLDGTVDTSAYRLGYELESRVEHSFVLKPATVIVTPVMLVQVPMGLNLHSDDRVSMNMLTAGVAPGRALVLEDVPMGRAICVNVDAIDQGREFVLRHLWDSALAVRLRLARGRVFPADTYAVVDVQAVPITREYRCTGITLRLEEIAIIARPQRSAAAVRPSGSVSAAGRIRPSGSLPLRRHSVANSAASVSSEDSVGRASDNATAFAQECSAEYQNAITKVRTLATCTHTAWPDRPSESLAEFSGIATKRLRLRVPPRCADMVTDLRNSHIQVHHQIGYEVHYERVDSADCRDASDATRIVAVAKVYRALATANIVRRDELKNSGRVVKGTLPVAVVPKKISALWGLKNSCEEGEEAYNEDDLPAVSDARLIDHDAAAALEPVAAAAYVPSPAMLSMMHSGSSSNGGGYGSNNIPSMPSVTSMPGPPSFAAMPSVPGMPTMPEVPMMPGVPGVPMMPSMPGVPSFPGMSGGGGVYPPAQQMGFNPMFMPQPAAPMGFAMGNGGGPSNVDMNYSGVVYGGSPLGSNYGMYGGYNPMGMQQQILMFQEQQRKQQEQFFQQLSEQYGQMVVSPSQLPTLPAAQLYGPSSSSSLSQNSSSAAVPSPLSGEVLPTAQEPDAVETPPVVPAVVVVPPPPSSSSPPPPVAEAVASGTESVVAAEPGAPEVSEQPVRPDSAADVRSADPAQSASITDAVEHSAASSENAVVERPVENAVESSTSASSQSNVAVEVAASGRHSPPPNYDDLLPPEYEVPANQPPPYRPMESNRSRRYAWNL